MQVVTLVPASPPYRVVFTPSKGAVLAVTYATEDEALEARDRALCNGFVQVRIEGLPTTGYSACSESTDPLEIEDN